MRLFVAVDVPDEIKRSIEEDVVEPLREHLPGARWTRPEGRHLTLKFLGNVADDRVENVGAALSGAVEGHDAVDAAFDELGGFPNLRRPRVLWLGIGPGAEELASLAGSVEGALQPLNFPGEGRPFRAHFTLARFPKPSVVGELPAVHIPSQRFAVRAVVLFRSQLHPKGARYTALEHFPLD